MDLRKVFGVENMPLGYAFVFIQCLRYPPFFEHQMSVRTSIVSGHVWVPNYIVNLQNICLEIQHGRTNNKPLLSTKVCTASVELRLMFCVEIDTKGVEYSLL